jgi:hypothetical protein
VVVIVSYRLCLEMPSARRGEEPAYWDFRTK